jgi:hypothetical protein
MLASGTFSMPKKIIYPSEWFPVNSTAAQTLIDTWLANVTAALNMTIEYQNVTEIFQDVIGYNGTLGDWTTNVSSVNIKDNWEAPLMGRQFVEDYGKAFGGRYPELDISVRTPWAVSPTYTQEYYDANTARAWEFTDFWNNVGHSDIPYPLFSVTILTIYAAHHPCQRRDLHRRTVGLPDRGYWWRCSRIP